MAFKGLGGQGRLQQGLSPSGGSAGEKGSDTAALFPELFSASLPGGLINCINSGSICSAGYGEPPWGPVQGMEMSSVGSPVFALDPV